MKKTLLKNIMYKNPPKPPIKESKVGDLYIEIGETIEEMETLFTKLAKLIHKSGEKNGWKISSDLGHQITKLKNVFGEVYDFKP
jgi:hypothetical protein